MIDVDATQLLNPKEVQLKEKVLMHYANMAYFSKNKSHSKSCTKESGEQHRLGTPVLSIILLHNLQMIDKENLLIKKCMYLKYL